jgi:hypothetical protein
MDNSEKTQKQLIQELEHFIGEILNWNDRNGNGNRLKRR